MAAKQLKPARLQPGDQVALISPASAPEDTTLIASGKQHLQKLGLRVCLGRNAGKQTGYLAGSDRQRTQDILSAFTNPHIKGVFCTRGGYGVSRLLEHLDVSKLRATPKALVGFSDITFLHLSLQKAGLISFWGPMPAASTGLSAFSAAWLQRALFNPDPIGLLPLGKEIIRTGIAEGRLTGGTLSLLAASIGTAYEIQTHGRIVFLEDIGEEPYRIDRMLTQLLAAGKLIDAAGIVLGTFRGCEPKVYASQYSFLLPEVLTQRLRPLRIPVCSGFPIGHIQNQVTLPYGVKARLNAYKCELEISESGVK